MFVQISFMTRIDDATSCENSIPIPLRSGITYFWIWLFDRAKYLKGDYTEARDTDEQPLYGMPLLMRCGGIYSA